MFALQDAHSCVCVLPDEAMTKLNNTVRMNEVDPKDFVALFVPGGHGMSPSPMNTGSLCC